MCSFRNQSPILFLIIDTIYRSIQAAYWKKGNGQFNESKALSIMQSTWGVGGAQNAKTSIVDRGQMRPDNSDVSGKKKISTEDTRIDCMYCRGSSIF